jgi:hypothetical protein
LLWTLDEAAGWPNVNPVLAGEAVFDVALAPNTGVRDVPDGELTEKLKVAGAGLAAAGVSSAPPSSMPLSSSASSIGGAATGATGAPKVNGAGLDAAAVGALAAEAPKLKGELAAGFASLVAVVEGNENGEGFSVADVAEVGAAPKAKGDEVAPVAAAG